MRYRKLALLFCVVLIGIAIVGGSSGDSEVNVIPTGEQLQQYNQAIAEAESQEELEN